MSRRQPQASRLRKETEEFLSQIQQSYQVDAHKQRVAQTDMVYLIGLPEQLAHEELLSRDDHCGHYGQITKVLVKENHFSQFSSYCAYVSYRSQHSAALAVLALNNKTIYGSKIYASYGTNKYCAAFVRYGRCRKQECPFLHSIDRQKEIHETDNRKLFQEQQKQALRYLQQHQSEIDYGSPSQKIVFPTKWEIKQRLVSQGALAPTSASQHPTRQNSTTRTSLIHKDKNNLRSEASTECSPSRQAQLEEDEIARGTPRGKELSIPNLIIRKVLRVKKSMFSFAMGNDVTESQQTAKDLRGYLFKSQLQKA